MGARRVYDRIGAYYGALVDNPPLRAARGNDHKPSELNSCGRADCSMSHAGRTALLLITYPSAGSPILSVVGLPTLPPSLEDILGYPQLSLGDDRTMSLEAVACLMGSIPKG
jgi:hypothetical protein